MQNEPLVIIGDLIASRKIENRREVQQRLQAVLEEVNQKYGGILMVPFEVTLGDEFVGVLQGYQKLLDLLHYMEARLGGIEVRYGISYGTFEGLNRGQAYQDALRSIKVARKNKYRIHLAGGDTGEELPAIINIVLHLYFRILSGLNGRQRYIVYEIARGKTQQEIAELLGTSQSSISQSLGKVNWRLLSRIYGVFCRIPEILKEGKKDSCRGDYIALIGAWPLERGKEEGIDGLLASINEKYRGIIRSGFVVTTLSPEDSQYCEFQGLLFNDPEAFEKVLELVVELYTKVEGLCLGLGIGNIVTRIEDRAVGMDGSAFHRAREAVGNCFSEQLQLNIKFFNNSLDYLYSLILGLFVEFIKGWSPRQALAVRLKQEGLTQNEIRERMNLSSRSTVVEHLQKAGWPDYKYILKGMAGLIKPGKDPTP